MPTEGDRAPDFTLRGVDGQGEEVAVRLGDLRGRRVVLYFYPKDDTSGCTTQACAIRDAWPDFGTTDAVVLGVSPDDVASHRKFRDRYDLPFTLLADPDHEVATAYGVWKEKSMYGRKYWGVERTTFLIDEEGAVARVFPRVKPEAHADEVLAALGG
ncbi:MAG TPA: thioredoxin-dependent thiol peroxidase [Longimicrobiales bacterium]|nr:thioredoxin-dependent thiol peroxidase [Longimicrobiales bacterium]